MTSPPQSTTSGSRDRLEVPRTVLVITDRIVYPARDGSSARIIGMIRALRSLGFPVVLIGRRPSTWRSRLRAWLLADHVRFVEARAFGSGSPFSYDLTPYVAAVDAAVRYFSPEVVIAEYIWMAPCLEHAPDALTLIDTLDLMHVRRHIYAAEGSGAWVDCSDAEEAQLLRKADVVIAIQPHEKAQFTSLVPDRSVICLGHAVPVRVSRWRHAAAKPVVMFVGSTNQGNVAGLSTFLREGWPLVLEACPAAQLWIYGNIVARIPCEGRGVRVVGYTRWLRRAYRNASVVINPVTLGTGLKIKTVEALAHGKAVVTTRCGAEGLESGAGEAFLVGQDMRHLAHHIVGLLRDPARRQATERNAVAFARKHFAAESVFREFLDLLSTRGLWSTPT